MSHLHLISQRCQSGEIHAGLALAALFLTTTAQHSRNMSSDQLLAEVAEAIAHLVRIERGIYADRAGR